MLRSGPFVHFYSQCWDPIRLRSLWALWVLHSLWGVVYGSPVLLHLEGFVALVFSIPSGSFNPSFSSTKFPEPFDGRELIPFGTECPKASHSLHIVQWYVSLFIPFYFRRRNLWWLLKEALICIVADSSKSFFCCFFSRILFSPMLLAYIVSGFWPPEWCLRWILPDGIDLKSNQISVHYSHTFSVTIALVHHACKSPLQTEGFVTGLVFAFLLWQYVEYLTRPWINTSR